MARRSQLDAATALESLLAPTFGPLGRSIAVRRHDGDLAVAKSASVLLPLLGRKTSESLPSSWERVFSSAARAQGDALGDGSTALVLCLRAGLLESDIQRNIKHISEDHLLHSFAGLRAKTLPPIIERVRRLHERCFFSSSSSSSSSDNYKIMRAVRECLLGTSLANVDESLANHIIEIVIKLAEMMEKKNAVTSTPPPIHIASGSSATRSLIIEGVILTSPLHRAYQRRDSLRTGTIVLMAGVVQEKREGADEFALKVKDHHCIARFATVDAIISSLAAVNATVVICQQRLSNCALATIRASGFSVICGVSEEEMTQLCAELELVPMLSTYATTASREELRKSARSDCDVAEISFKNGDTKWVTVRGGRKNAVSAIIRAPTRAMASCHASLFQSCWRLMFALSDKEDGSFRFGPGGCIFDISLAAHLMLLHDDIVTGKATSIAPLPETGHPRSWWCPGLQVLIEVAMAAPRRLLASLCMKNHRRSVGHLASVILLHKEAAEKSQACSIGILARRCSVRAKKGNVVDELMPLLAGEQQCGNSDHHTDTSLGGGTEANTGNPLHWGVITAFDVDAGRIESASGVIEQMLRIGGVYSCKRIVSRSIAEDEDSDD